MNENRLHDYIDHIHRAATKALGFVKGLSKEDFLADLRTQKAVVMNLVIIGEAAAQVMDRHAEFTGRHSGVPWRSMRGMRNRIAHGYFDINLEVVWNTVQTALPELIDQLALVVRESADEDADVEENAVKVDRGLS